MTKAGIKKKVWRIFHFEQRFEMDDYRRQGGLDYIRMFVTATTAGKSNESTEFFQQIAELKHYYPDQYYAHFGIFWTLGSLTATKESWLRGYLVDADLAPLTESKIAARLQISKKLTRQALTALKRVGLIEFIECPEFKCPRQEETAKAKKPGKKAAGKKAAQRSIRKHSETFGNVSKPFKNKNKTKTNSNKKKKVNKQKARSDKTTVAARKEKNDNGNSKLNANVQSNNQASSQGQSKGQGQEEPPTTPPFKPHGSDDLGGSHVIPFTTTPQTSLEPDSRRERPAVATVAVGYDRYDEQIGKRVYVALGYRYEVSSPAARREICSFASKWHHARNSLSGLPPPVIDELGRRVIAEAGKIARRRGNRNKGAVWCTVVDKLVRARLREAM